MEYPPIEAVTDGKQPAAVGASAYGLESILVDGNDADAMLDVARSTIGRARDGDGPSLVEAVTYRHGGHSRADPAKYRPEAEVREGLGRDPATPHRGGLLPLRGPGARGNGSGTAAPPKGGAPALGGHRGPPPPG